MRSEKLRKPQSGHFADSEQNSSSAIRNVIILVFGFSTWTVTDVRPDCFVRVTETGAASPIGSPLRLQSSALIAYWMPCYCRFRFSLIDLQDLPEDISTP